ncbi:hypothetical protein N24_3171 [Corynebacterium suranareeae]|uniref:Uncharacterized protein n=1 Tax=Corynebacterium suranareeae TaxID=2506452 RepID=A0A169SCU5_9CORY|nr:hypothetical protein [Corynebacterium suranareeae]BAU97433.1 hypothetical protein N24_3171 [Corynebacterium suranareeae]
MDVLDFQRQATEFALDIKDLLDTCLPGETGFRQGTVATEGLRANFEASKVLYLGKDRSNRASISCGYYLCANSTGKHLAVESSSFKVEFKANKRPIPIVRFEYERHARNKPVQHFQFHSESLPLAILLARAGRYDIAAQQQDVHFPMGGHRYRVCLEDIVELVIREFRAEANPNWETRVQEGRRVFRERQTDTIIRKNLVRSVEMLKELGFKIEPPQGYEFPERRFSDEW